MKFDPSRAMEIVMALADPRFAGPDGETRLASFVAGRFSELGWQVECREVIGSAFPHRAAAGIGWLGLGLVTTGGTVIVGTSGNRGTAHLLGWPLLVLGAAWLYLALHRGFRLGRGWPPTRTAPVVVARRGDASPPASRVVFQTPIGRLAARPDPSTPWLSSRVGELLYAFLACEAIAMAWAGPNRPGSWAGSRMLGAGLLGLFWAYLAGRSLSEIRSRRSKRSLEPADQTGVAVLLELARTWSPPRAHRFEVVLAATGGQALDLAGARSMLRSTSADSRRIPTLHLLWFAPGIGSQVLIVSQHLRNLARSAAESLWVPHGLASRWVDLLDLWPLERSPTDFVALIGADSVRRAEAKDVVDPAALHRTAQLAVEIALRWARQQQRLP